MTYTCSYLLMCSILLRGCLVAHVWGLYITPDYHLLGEYFPSSLRGLPCSWITAVFDTSACLSDVVGKEGRWFYGHTKGSKPPCGCSGSSHSNSLISSPLTVSPVYDRNVEDALLPYGGCIPTCQLWALTSDLCMPVSAVTVNAWML